MIRIEKITAKAETKSTAARKDVPESSRAECALEAASASKRPTPPHRSKGPGKAGTQALPVDIKPDVAQRIERAASNFEVSGSSPDVRANPPKQFSKTEYQQKYMADLRTIKRLGLNCTVKEWRSEELARSAMLALRKSKET